MRFVRYIYIKKELRGIVIDKTRSMHLEYQSTFTNNAGDDDGKTTKVIVRTYIQRKMKVECAERHHHHHLYIVSCHQVERERRRLFGYLFNEGFANFDNANLGESYVVFC